MTIEPHDDDLNNVSAVLSPPGETATPEDVAYESGYHDGIDYGYRLALQEVHDAFPLLEPDPTSDAFQELIW